MVAQHQSIMGVTSSEAWFSATTIVECEYVIGVLYAVWAGASTSALYGGITWYV